MDQRVSATGSSSYGQACMQCYKAKCRCVARPNSDGCERCLRLKKQCQPSDSVRRRVLQNPETGAQIAKLEGKIEALTSMLQSVVKATGVSADLPPYLNESLTAASTGDTISNSATTYTDVGAGPTPLSDGDPQVSSYLGSFCTGGSSLSPPPPLYWPQPDEAEGYLELFRNRMLPFFPFIDLPTGLTTRELHQNRPFLFRAIIAVATPSKEQKLARAEELKRILAKSAVLENQSNIDMLLGILTYITWSIDPFLKRTSNLSRMIMLAISLVYDLQMIKSTPPESHVMATMAPGFGDTGQGANDASSESFLEQQRAFLACFVLSSIISSYFRRIDPMRWTPQMEEGLRIIKTNKKCPSDEAFAFQIRLQLLAQKVSQVRDQQDADYTHVVRTPATPPAPVSLYIKVLQTELQGLKASFSPHHEIDMLTANAHYVELCIYETTRLTTSEAPLVETPESAGSAWSRMPGFERLEALWGCLRAAKSWLDILYTVSPSAFVGFPFFYWFQLVRCLIILKHLSTFEDPAWDWRAVHNTVDIVQLLEWMAEKAEVASREAGEQSDNNLFFQVSRILRRSTEWIHQKRKAAAQATEGSTSFASIRNDGPGLATADEDMSDFNQLEWMSAFETGDETWLEEYFGWAPGTL